MAIYGQRKPKVQLADNVRKTREDHREGCILAHWKEIGGQPGGSGNKKTLIKYCNQWCPLCTLEDGEKWPFNGSLNYNTILQLMLFLWRDGNGMRLCMRICGFCFFLLCGIARRGRRIAALTSRRTEAALEQREMPNRGGFTGRGRGKAIQNKDFVTVAGATGQQEKAFFLKPINFKDLHPVVAHPYTLLTKLQNNQVWLTVLDLKDAFFCLPLAKESQNLFAFEWESPPTGKPNLPGQRYPKVLRRVQPFLGINEHENLRHGILPPEMELFYDDLFTATETKSDCIQWTVTWLNFVGPNGYRVSQQKAQMVRQQVTYLGYELSGRRRELGTERKEAICRTPPP
ncbi:LOW QUALITY PROTEIN: hypothetical protein QYF61_013578 [Mycteria americana]|uniref:Reverse transcriptase domain-containing protein n=1 Tax=Mycteria americana TaxID=33587 RepID=A0AAN7MGV6_MYCAM|nr:LOW QUALITY PROTEIN: hypothetical protein QYF61_013578 [Mycteria americana]